MASIKITEEDRNDPLWGDRREGILTDVYAARSYGLPVAVFDGVPYGTAEVGILHPIYPTLAGADDDPAVFRSDEWFRANRDPEAVELVRRAQAAGYSIRG